MQNLQDYLIKQFNISEGSACNTSYRLFQLIFFNK